jgi:putative ABC transport system substrate-binding protein
MRRRDFIAGLGSAAACPAAAHAQANSMRRIGVLIEFDEDDPEARSYLSGFVQELQPLGWIEGRTVRIDVRWAAGSVQRMRMFAKELVDLQPDVLLASSTPVTAALQRETRSVPIVFVLVADPIGSGFVASLPRPGGNLTGFSNLESSIAGKWVELLTEIAPGVTRVVMMFNPDTAPGGGSHFLPSFEAAAKSLKIEPITAPVHSDAEIEMAITSLGRQPGGGLVLMADGFLAVHRRTIILLTARNNIPAVAGLPPSFARSGGLLCYAADPVDIYRRAAAYADRILRGAKPVELPVQLPIKFSMILNAKTAKALNLAVPSSILVRADEVIE